MPQRDFAVALQKVMNNKCIAYVAPTPRIEGVSDTNTCGYIQSFLSTSIIYQYLCVLILVSCLVFLILNIKSRLFGFILMSHVPYFQVIHP